MTTKETSAKAAVLRKVGGPFTVETIEVGAPREDEVLVRVAGAGVCHTDAACAHGFPVPLPIVLGHEGSGVVEAIGDKVKTLKPGDHVVLSFSSCGVCRSCRSGQPASCLQFVPFNFAGVRLADGSTPLSQGGSPIHGMFFGQSSFASYAIARAANTVRVAKSAPLELLGPLGCGVQTGAGAMMNSLRPGARDALAIFGGGAVGLSALLGARAMGVGAVFVVEPNAGRRALATELGAKAAIDPRAVTDVAAALREASGGGITHALDTTGIPPVIAQAITSMVPGGVVGLIGIPPPDAQVPATLLDLAMKGVTLRPITEGDADPQTFIPKLVELYQQGKFPFDRLIKKYPFDQINQAFMASATGEAVKPVLVL